MSVIWLAVVAGCALGVLAREVSNAALSAGAAVTFPWTAIAAEAGIAAVLGAVARAWAVPRAPLGGVARALGLTALLAGATTFLAVELSVSVMAALAAGLIVTVHPIVVLAGVWAGYAARFSTPRRAIAQRRPSGSRTPGHARGRAQHLPARGQEALAGAAK